MGDSWQNQWWYKLDSNYLVRWRALTNLRTTRAWWFEKTTAKIHAHAESFSYDWRQLSHTFLYSIYKLPFNDFFHTVKVVQSCKLRTAPSFITQALYPSPSKMFYDLSHNLSWGWKGCNVTRLQGQKQWSVTHIQYKLPYQFVGDI